MSFPCRRGKMFFPLSAAAKNLILRRKDMKNFSSKKALFLSVISMVICVSMLIGSTFAWFTDSATANVNTIQAGNLDVELVGKDGKTKSSFRSSARAMRITAPYTLRRTISVRLSQATAKRTTCSLKMKTALLRMMTSQTSFPKNMATESMISAMMNKRGEKDKWQKTFLIR